MGRALIDMFLSLDGDDFARLSLLLIDHDEGDSGQYQHRDNSPDGIAHSARVHLTLALRIAGVTPRLLSGLGAAG